MVSTSHWLLSQHAPHLSRLALQELQLEGLRPTATASTALLVAPLLLPPLPLPLPLPLPPLLLQSLLLHWQCKQCCLASASCRLGCDPIHRSSCSTAGRCLLKGC